MARYVGSMIEEKNRTGHIRPRRFHETAGLEDWRVVGEGACAYFRTGSFAAGAQLVRAISELPGVVDDHPDVDLRREGVTVRLITLTDDYYDLDDIGLAFHGRNSGRSFALGDKVTVQIIKVDVLGMQMDFQLVRKETKSGGKEKKKRGKGRDETYNWRKHIKNKRGRRS